MAIITRSKRQSEGSVSINILNRRADYPEVQELAEKRGGRLPTLAEFIKALGDDPKFYEKTRGDWYWVGNEQGLKISGYCRINYEKGTAEEIPGALAARIKEWRSLPLKERTYVFAGKGPIALGVSLDTEFGRISINADSKPTNTARVALVPKADFPMEGLRRSD